MHKQTTRHSWNTERSAAPPMEFLTRPPAAEPEDDRVIVHAALRRGQQPGAKGTRAWLQQRDASMERCDCGAWSGIVHFSLRSRKTAASRF